MSVESNFDSVAPTPEAPAPAPETNDAPESTDAVETEASPVEAAAEKVLNNPKSTPAQKQVAEKKLEKFKLKVYGKEVEEEIDLNDRAELTKRFQKSRAADQSMAEAAEVRKAALEFIDQLKKNPRQVLSDPNIGLDIRKFAEEILNEEIKEMEKSPEQREKEKLHKELEQYKKQAKDNEDKAKTAKMEQLQKQHEVELETQIGAALDIGGIPKNAKTVARMADYLIAGLNNNMDLKVSDIVPLVKRDIDNELKDIMTSLSDDKLEAFLGKEVIGRLRKKNVAKARAIDTASNLKDTGNIKREAPKQEAKKSYRDFFGR